MPAIKGRPAVTVSYEQMHVAFTAADGTIIDYYYDDEAGWMSQSLTRLTGSQHFGKSGVATITTEGQWHALFDADNEGFSHIYYANGDGWFYEDLQAKARSRAMEGGAACAVTPGQLHTFYRDDQNHVSHVYFRDGAWHWEDMANVVRGSLADATDDPAAIFVYDQLHVAYLAGGGLGHFYYDGNWVRQDMITGANHAPSAQGIPVFLAYDNRLECFYRDRNDRLARLYFADGAWHYEDLTAKSQCPVGAAGDPAAIGYGGQPHIVFRDSNGHVALLTTDNGKWRYENLSQNNGAPNAASDPALGIYAEQLHVFFASVDNQINDIYRDGDSWKVQNLDQIVKYPAPIHAMSLHNAGLYVVSMSFVYLTRDGRQKDSSSTSTFMYGETKTADPGNYGVPDGAELWIKASADGGETVRGHEHFIYSPRTAHGTARYHCAGMVRNVTLIYDGIDAATAAAAEAETAAPAADMA